MTFIDGPVKSRETPLFVIPAKVLRQAQDRELVERPESSYIEWFQLVWTPVFTGVTTFYETIFIGPQCFLGTNKGKGDIKAMERCPHYWSSLLLIRGAAPKPLLAWCGHRDSSWRRDTVKEMACRGELQKCLIPGGPGVEKQD